MPTDIVLQYHSPDELFPEACLDPKLASQTPQQVFRGVHDTASYLLSVSDY